MVAAAPLYFTETSIAAEVDAAMDKLTNGHKKTVRIVFLIVFFMIFLI